MYSECVLLFAPQSTLVVVVVVVVPPGVERTQHTVQNIRLVFFSCQTRRTSTNNKTTQTRSALTIGGSDDGTVPVRLWMKNLLFVHFIVAVSIFATIWRVQTKVNVAVKIVGERIASATITASRGTRTSTSIRRLNDRIGAALRQQTVLERH